MTVGPTLQELVLAGAGAAELRAEATRLGLRGLRQGGLARVAEGALGLDDVLRATGDHLP